MNMTIGENIKCLRKDKGITQEKLAEHLNISCQAISKWERGETLPDITLVIPIADYFGVPTDQLLGVDHAKNEQKILTLLAECDRLGNLGKLKEKCDLNRKAYKEFPNDFRIISNYLMSLLYDPYIDKLDHVPGIPTHNEEMKRVCNRILEECTNENFRYQALNTLIEVYKNEENHEKAVEIIERFPEGIWSKGVMYEYYYEPGSAEQWHWARYNIRELSGRLIAKFTNCAMWSESPPQERIRQFQKTVDLICLIYEDGDYNDYHKSLCHNYYEIAQIYVQIEDYTNAEKYIDLALFHAKAFDDLPQVTTHTSFFMQGNKFDKSEVYYAYECNTVKSNLDYFEDARFFAGVRDMPWFKAVLDKYRPYASDSKG